MFTKAANIGGAIVAEEFAFMHEQLGAASGNLLTLRATTLPDEGKFTNASLRGEYAYTLLGHGGPAPQAGLGVMTYDGQGQFTGNATVNLPGSSYGERSFVSAEAKEFLFFPSKHFVAAISLPLPYILAIC
jgi:hypothetical protein